MRKHKSNRIIGVITFLLMGIGLLIIYAIGPQRANFMNSAQGTDYSENYFFLHQLISVAFAIAAFIFAFRYPYEKIRRWAKTLMAASLIICAIMALFTIAQHGESGGVLTCALGGCRWFSFGFFSFQPAELLKLSLILYLPQLIQQHKAEGTFETKEFFIPLAIVSALSLFFVVVMQKDMGTGVVVMAIILAILWASGLKMRYFEIIAAVIVAAGVLAILTSPHRLERLMTFSGSSDSDSSYHIENALLAIGTGGLFGVGLGNSVQATGYLPESINDSVFAIMGETFGFVGLLAVLVAFLILLTNILKTANATDSEERLVCTGVFAWIATHVIVNVMAMTGLIPLTGITLPLLSYGGTSIAFIAAALGLTMQLSQYTSRVTTPAAGYRRRRLN